MAKGIDASKATIVASIEVIVATLSGVFLLNEQINWVGYIGIIVMLASIVLMNINIPNVKGAAERQKISALESQ